MLLAACALGLLLSACASSGTSVTPPNGATSTVVGEIRSTANEPIEDATVFVDQTTTRVASKADGTFRLSGIGLGMQRVVFYHPDFEFGTVLVDPVVQGSDTLRVILSPRAAAAPQATAPGARTRGPVEMSEPDEALPASPPSTPSSRSRAIDQFARLFLGTHEECTLETPDVLDAEMDRDGTVRVQSTQPVSVSNDRLGYDVQIILDRVVLNNTPNGFNRQAEAHLQFTPQVDAAAVTAQIRAAREEAYIGSFPHFLAALVEGRLFQEGLDYQIPVGGAEQSRGLAGAAGGGGLVEDWAEFRNPDRLFSYIPASAVVVFESIGVRRIVHRSRAGLQRDYARKFVGAADALGRPVSFYEVQTNATRLTLAGNVVSGRPVERQGAWANTPVCYQLPLDYRPNR